MKQIPIDPVRSGILDAAERLFVRYGYKKTTVDEIAQEAHIGKGTVYLHFESKEDVGICWLRRLHEAIFVDLEQIKDEPSDARVRLKKFIEERVLKRFDIFQAHQRSMDDALGSIPPETIEMSRQTFHLRERQLLIEILESGIQNQTIICPNLEETAEAIVIATNSLMPYKQRPELLGDRNQVQRKAGIVADLVIRAINPNRE